jgi:hypothetical protein
MEESKLSNCQPSYLLAHDLVNKLSVIVGYCDLMKEIAAADPIFERRLRIVSDLAKGMAKELQELQDHQRNVGLTVERGLAKRPTAGEGLAPAEKQSA